MIRDTFIRVLKRRDFSRLWIAQLLSQVAANMLTFALVLHIYDLTKSLTTISLVIIATSIPSVIFGPFSGVLTDRVRYKKVLIYTNFLRFLVALILIPATNNTLAILELLFLMATITQFFAPAEMSSIPLVVNKEQMVTANSIYITVLYGSLILGYGIAGPLLALIGAKLFFLIVAALYLVAMFFVNNMSEYDQKEVHGRLTISNLAKNVSSVWQETKDGLRYVLKDKSVFSPLLKLTIGWAMFGAFIVMIPGFAENVIGISAKLSGVILIAPAGVGMVIASYLLNKYKSWDKSKTITVGFIICGSALFALAIYNFYKFFNLAILIAIILMVILGMSASFVYISSQTLLQLNSAGKLRGRVFGIAAMTINLAMGVPALFVGGIADLTSTVFTLILLSLIIIIYGASLFYEESYS